MPQVKIRHRATARTDRSHQYVPTPNGQLQPDDYVCSVSVASTLGYLGVFRVFFKFGGHCRPVDQNVPPSWFVAQLTGDRPPQIVGIGPPGDESGPGYQLYKFIFSFFTTLLIYYLSK